MEIPELVGHRGYPWHYPENTLAGFAAAMAAGARYVETDVQLTADEVPVLFHDGTLKRLTGAAGAVREYPLEQLRTLHASDNDRFGYKFAQEPIPTLGEFVELVRAHPQVTAFVEIKRTALRRFGVSLTLNRVLRELKPALNQCVLISYSMEALAAARGRGYPTMGIVIDHWRERRQEIVAQIRPDYVFCDADGLPMFGKVGFPGARVAVWEITDPVRALALARRGVELVETFAFDEMRRGIEVLAAQK
jgi:glycerophosphoryl diester phosphodiesterase